MADQSGRFVHAKKAGHPFGYPAFPKPRKRSAACFEPSDASETLSGAFLSFPTRRKRSAARFDTFRGLGGVYGRPVELLVCWGPGARLMLVCWGLAARWFVEVGTRVGAYYIRPTKRAPRARMDGRRVCSFIPCGMFVGRMRYAPTPGTCIRVPSGTRPDSPASADAPAKRLNA